MTTTLQTHERPPRTPSCPVCSDTGWKTVQIPGKPDRATRCECFIARRTERLLKAAQIPVRYRECSIENFDTEFEEANVKLVKARLASRRFIENYPTEKRGLLFVGPIGTGKTHLAVSIIRDLMRLKGISCLFCDYREMLKEIGNSYNPGVQATELEILNPACNTEILVLDDLGAVKPSEWVWDTVSYVINHRYNENKTTIFTTNFPDLPPPRFEEPLEGFSQKDRPKPKLREETLGDRITERMRSRLHEMCWVVDLDGQDFRMKRKKKF